MNSMWKKINLLPLGLMTMLCCVACSPHDPNQNQQMCISPTKILGGGSFTLSNGSAAYDKHYNRVMKDTITPPSNPMNEVPIRPGTMLFKGVLTLEYFGDELFCSIQADFNDYFLIDTTETYILRLNDPLLKHYAVGDTIVIMAEPMLMQRDYCLTTYRVNPIEAYNKSNYQ